MQKPDVLGKPVSPHRRDILSVAVAQLAALDGEITILNSACKYPAGPSNGTAHQQQKLWPRPAPAGRARAFPGWAWRRLGDCGCTEKNSALMQEHCRCTSSSRRFGGAVHARDERALAHRTLLDAPAPSFFLARCGTMGRSAQTLALPAPGQVEATHSAGNQPGQKSKELLRAPRAASI